MVARLWWKEARMFWPIWVFLVVVAGVTQFLLIRYVGDGVRTGGLAVVALGWTCFYAFAVAAASFAGERENRTLALLDSLPIDRWRLWASKSSFALLTTFMLGLGLLGLAAVGSFRFDFSPLGVPWTIFLGVVIVLHALGWGLLWSALLSNALVAAALAVCTTALSAPMIDTGLNLARQYGDEWPIELALAIVTTIASAGLFVISGPPRKALSLRRPWRQAPSAGPAQELVGAERPPVAASPAHAVLRLAWQSIRQIGSVWWWMVLLALFVPFLLSVWSRSAGDPTFWFLFQIGIAIVAGVGVFGSENPPRTYRFLAHHGVRPSLVWLVRMSVWGVALGVLLLVAALGILLSGGARRIPISSIAILWFLTLAVSVLCGMTIRRGITAGMVSLLLVFTLGAAGSGLVAMGMVPTWVMVVAPLIILAVSVAWTGEWMLDRPGLAKWLKLAVLIVVTFAALVAGYIVDRVVSVPALEPDRDAKLFTIRTSATIPADENAAELYRQAGLSVTTPPEDMYKALVKDWNDMPEKVKDWFHKNAKALELIRQAAAKPNCQFAPIDKLTMFDQRDTPINYGLLYPLPALSARERMAKGDLDGAWKEILVLFRMAHHLGGAVPWREAFTSANVEKQAVELAMVWSADGKQTAERLRSALEAFRELPRHDAADPIRVEALTIENTAKLPRAELIDNIVRMRSEPRDKPQWTDSLWASVVTTPWELERTRRAFRLLYASRIVEASADPWFSGRTVPSTGLGGYSKLAITSSQDGPIVAPATLDEIEQTTPLARSTLAPVEAYLRPWWRNEVGRRALVQILALRIWQLSHGGKLPDRLGVLVADGLLSVLPTDPFTPNRHFGYVRSSGQKLLPLGSLDPFQGPGVEVRPIRPVENSWLLYSVGPDGEDDHAEKNDLYRDADDIVFPLAESIAPSKPEIGNKAK
jgi:hypothetical protein